MSERKRRKAARSGVTRPAPLIEAQIPQLRRTVAFKPTPTHLRDAVTGVPLVFGSSARDVVTRAIVDPDMRRDRQPIPQSIDSRAAYHVNGTSVRGRRDYLGGLRWTPEFERYIKPVLPASIAEAQRIWREWWTVPYITQRLQLEMGAEKFGAVLALVRDGEEIDEIADRLRHTLGWVTRQKSRAVRIVRDRYLPYALLERIEWFAQSLTA